MALCDERIGPRGPMGLQGLTGLTGASGATGATGAQGAQGLQGQNGVAGSPGARGEKGDRGDKGDTGPAGVPGIDGLPGPQGLAGINGIHGNIGNDGPQGPTGPTGKQGATGVQGNPGLDGRYLLGSYVSLTGIGNSDPIGDETLLFSKAIIGNTLSNDGDELEFFLSTEYFGSNSVDLIFELSPTNRYVYTYINVNNDIRTIKVLVTRISSASQVWNIEDVCKDLVGLGITVKTLASSTTTFDLTLPTTFNLFADNAVIGVNQVVLKKCSMYLNKLQ